MNKLIAWRLRAALFTIMIVTGALIVLSVCGAWVSITDFGRDYVNNNVVSSTCYVSDITLPVALDMINFVGENDVIANFETTKLFVVMIYVYVAVMMCIQLHYVYKTFMLDITEKFIGGASGIYELIITAVLGIVPCVVGNAAANFTGELIFIPGFAFYLTIVLSVVRVLCVGFIYSHNEKVRKHSAGILEELKSKYKY